MRLRVVYTSADSASSTGAASAGRRRVPTGDADFSIAELTRFTVKEPLPSSP